MLRHYLIAALRNLRRNKLYAAINIVGLAVGFAAAILISLYVRHETSYDAWLPSSDRTYLLVGIWTHSNGAVERFRETPDELAPRIALGLPSIGSLTRLIHNNKVPIRHGNVEIRCRFGMAM
jgi:putative ABC transport system permease protein